MNRTRNPVASGLLLALALGISAACSSGPPAATPITGASDRLPADGSPGGPGLPALTTTSIKRADWAKFDGDRLKPACDARGGAGKPDVAALKGAGDVIAQWMEFHKKPKSGPKTDDGKRLGGGVEPTRVVNTVGLTCSATANTVEVNGTQYPFDVAWVLSGKGTGPAISGGEGAGYFAMIQAVSLKEKKVVFAKVYVPSDANDDSDDTIIVSNVATYIPAAPEEPIMRVTGRKEDPVFETLVFEKGAKEGFAYRVPREVTVGRARYLGVARFVITE